MTNTNKLRAYLDNLHAVQRLHWQRKGKVAAAVWSFRQPLDRSLWAGSQQVRRCKVRLRLQKWQEHVEVLSRALLPILLSLAFNLSSHGDLTSWIFHGSGSWPTALAARWKRNPPLRLLETGCSGKIPMWGWVWGCGGELSFCTVHMSVLIDPSSCVTSNFKGTFSLPPTLLRRYSWRGGEIQSSVNVFSSYIFVICSATDLLVTRVVVLLHQK